MLKRVNEVPLPDIQIIDMKKEKKIISINLLPKFKKI